MNEYIFVYITSAAAADFLGTRRMRNEVCQPLSLCLFCCHIAHTTRVPRQA